MYMSRELELVMFNKLEKEEKVANMMNKEGVLIKMKMIKFLRIGTLVVRGRGSLLQPPGGVSLRSTPPVQACLRQETHYNITSFGDRDNLTKSVLDPTITDNFWASAASPC